MAGDLRVSPFNVRMHQRGLGRDPPGRHGAGTDGRDLAFAQDRRPQNDRLTPGGQGVLNSEIDGPGYHRPEDVSVRQLDRTAGQEVVDRSGDGVGGANGGGVGQNGAQKAVNQALNRCRRLSCAAGACCLSRS